MTTLYTPSTNFGAKDTLPENDPDKVIRGLEFTNEFNAIAAAIAVKSDISNDILNDITVTGLATFDDVLIQGTLDVIGVATFGPTVIASMTFNGADLQTTLDNLDQDITDIEADITTIEGDITAIEGDVTTLQGDVITNATDINTVQSELNVLESTVNNLTTNISTDTIDLGVYTLGVDAGDFVVKESGTVVFRLNSQADGGIVQAADFQEGTFGS